MAMSGDRNATAITELLGKAKRVFTLAVSEISAEIGSGKSTHPEVNRLYYGESLQVMREHIADESIDLIYLDPMVESEEEQPS